MPNSGDTSVRLDLPYIQPAQAQKHVTHNEALHRLDALVQMTLVELGAETPPAEPAPGDIHGLGATPQGAWAGQAGKLAHWDGSGWNFIVPRDGWRGYDLLARRAVVHDGTDWQADLPDLAGLDGVGINTGWDGVNRLSLASQASLFSHEGTGGHQLKVNKAGAADTASLLFQTGFSGRAEMGTAGNDAFSIKVSADGTAWRDAFRADPATGTVDIAGKRAYHRGNVLGTAGQTGGLPTGALIERAANANGEYVRFADGTQICTVSRSPAITTGAHGPLQRSTSDFGAWTFPAAFASAPTVVANIESSNEWASCGIALSSGISGVIIFAVNPLNAITRTVRVTATGRWF